MLSRADRLRAAGWLDVRRMRGGGMGELFRGYDPNLQKEVVAKFIRADALGEATLARFRVEAAALARVENPNVARMFGYVESDDPYLVLEYVDGGSLDARLHPPAPAEPRPLAAEEAAELMEGVARGVAAAHAVGIIHRDLKPGNILLAPVGVSGGDSGGAAAVPKVTDFGMAKDADAVEPLTGTGAVLGTPEYMSPEQAARHSARCDARSDVWGLAATLYAAVTGHPPFTRNLLNPPVLTQPLVPPQVHAPHLPDDLAAVIVMGLEKHPNDRYQTATDFADDLRRFRDGQPVRARRRAWPVRVWRRAQRLPGVATASVLVAVAAVALLAGALLLRDPTPAEAVARKVAALANGDTAVLIRPGQPPVWHRPLHGVPTVVASPDGGCTVSAVGSAVCQFAPDLPVDHYLVKMTVADIESTAVTRPGEAIHRFGLLLGAEPVPGRNGFAAVAGFALEYHDLRKRDEGDRPIRARADTVFRSWLSKGGRPLDPYTSSLHEKALEPTRVGRTPGLFRDLEFDVSPAGIRGYWPGDPAVNRTASVAYTAALLDAKTRVHAQSVPEIYPDASAAYPPWNPRRGVAVVVKDCTVAIRALEIVPLPD